VERTTPTRHGGDAVAGNKTQHYVPQFYLRNFSTDPGKRSLNLFNLDRARVIPRVSIRDQCARDYWWKDQQLIEDGVRSLEGSISEIIRVSIETNSITHTFALKAFVTLQRTRTLHAAEEFEEVYLIRHGRLPENRVVSRALNAALAPYYCYAILDMPVCLIVNRTNLEFITSDHPVVLCNWWHRKIQQYPFSGTGYNSAGLEIYFPLSPRHCLLVYDRNIWRLKTSDSHSAIYIRNESDVFAINERQMLNARANIYFASSETSAHILQLFAECGSRRKQSKVKLDQVSSDYNDEVEVVVWRNELEVMRRVTMLAKRHKPAWQVLERLGDGSQEVVRDRAWVQILRQFWDAERKPYSGGLPQFNRLGLFAAQHPLMDSVGRWKQQFWELKIGAASPSRSGAR
jgi:hypothetical protein